ncbi:4'-phosphopantetheinyl transferase family protein [Bradyrhizobium sp. AZCC 2262]|uniref:4'-phosphopantetheinyl transferase family protein n=1 Tax=Bradyrhizobium sp. AZCC 2262 TaxID=3117022 RepID=UPI003FA5AA40
MTSIRTLNQWRRGLKVRPEYGEVHVWRMQFSSTNHSKQAWPLMSDQERARASAFRFEPDRERFCKSRLLVRCVLGRYLDLDPAEVDIKPGPNGKPFIDNASGNHGIEFNLAHCRSEALLAVTSGQSVGIDVEDGGSIHKADVDALAQECLTDREAQILQSLAGPDRVRAFLLCWTRKEALLKAVGQGLLAKLNDFEVPLDCASWRVSWTPESSTKASIFEMADLSEGNVLAAVAATRIVGPVTVSNFHDLHDGMPTYLQVDGD